MSFRLTHRRSYFEQRLLGQMPGACGQSEKGGVALFTVGPGGLVGYNW